MCDVHQCSNAENVTSAYAQEKFQEAKKQWLLLGVLHQMFTLQGIFVDKVGKCDMNLHCMETWINPLHSN